MTSPRVPANAIAPGLIDTPMLASMNGPARDKLTDKVPMRHTGTPEDIAEAAAFLAVKPPATSPAPSWTWTAASPSDPPSGNAAPTVTRWQWARRPGLSRPRWPWCRGRRAVPRPEG
ncbi:SDR family oxidoreductase [Streptomyces cellulosae]|uniref:SDR family oxidoreductase n=1 Tax=Streptomyces cellulosae TaxID=1968 RepID=A0ABW7YFC9_STRCE